MSLRSTIHAVAVLLIGMFLASPAGASFHEWRFSEIFSDASGQIQFIEFDGSVNNGEHFLTGHAISTDANNFTFMTDLPSALTAGKKFLVGTAAYAALPGAVAPDYIIPGNFFNPRNDNLNYAFVDFQTIDATFPTDGVTSLLGDGTTAANSPENFTGEVGSIDASGNGTPIPLPTGIWTFIVTVPVAYGAYVKAKGKR